MAVNSSKKKKKKKSLQNIIDETKIEDDKDKDVLEDVSFDKTKINDAEDTTTLDDTDEEETLKSETPVEKTIEDEIINEEEDTTKEEVVIDKEITKNNNQFKYLLLIIFLILFIIICYFIMPKIKLKGNKNLNISYNDNYVEPGYKASFMFKDISKKIKVNNSVKNGNIGKYKIIYSYRFGFINFKKTRIVNIVDNIKPEIKIDDEITLCPKEDINNIKYEVIDEYDGNITKKAISNYLDNKLIISAKDKSNNEVRKEIIVKKEDNDKPSIKLKGNETIYINYGNTFNEPGYEASDNCDGDITDKVIINGSVGNNIGTYKITYSVSDNEGNKNEITRTVIIRNNYLYNSGTIGSGTIYLTFDDGPSSGTTNVILDVLKEEGVKATFFVTCNGPDSLIKRMYDEGHTVALHTATHNYSYVYSSIDNYFADLNRVSNRVKNITGVESKIIRFPGGSSNTISRNYKYGIMTDLTHMVLEKGYRYFDWNVDSNDAGGARSSSEVYNNVTSHLSKNRSNVVLMHDIKATTRDAIRNIIKYGKANGYSFDKINMDTYMIRHGVNN